MKIFLSPLAERKLELLLDFIETKWSSKTRKEFLAKLTKSFNQISQLPKSFPESEGFPNLFKCIVTKQTSMFYRIKGKEIEIITIIDNRQNPSSIEEELKHWH